MVKVSKKITFLIGGLVGIILLRCTLPNLAYMTVSLYKASISISNCPPSTAVQTTTELYRLMVPNDLKKSFNNYLEENPEREELKNDCRAYGLSFWDSIDKIKELAQKENNSGKHICKIKITQDVGVVKQTGKPGHYTIWLYNSLKLEELTIEPITV